MSQGVESHDIESMPAFVAAAVEEVFSALVGIEPGPATTTRFSGSSGTHDISAVISLSGSLNGTIALRSTIQAAGAFVASFAGEPMEPDTDDFSDAFGELANMISGSAKAKYNSSSLSIGCPTVVLAPNHQIKLPSGTTCWAVSFETPSGPLTVEIGISAANIQGAQWRMVDTADAPKLKSA